MKPCPGLPSSPAVPAGSAIGASLAILDALEDGALDAVGNAFDALDLPGRARLLALLLGAIGPLGLAVIGEHAFSRYVPHARSGAIPLSLDDAARATPTQVAELARYVAQSDPELFVRLGAMFAGVVTAAAGHAIPLAVGGGLPQPD